MNDDDDDDDPGLRFRVATGFRISKFPEFSRFSRVFLTILLAKCVHLFL